MKKVSFAEIFIRCLMVVLAFDVVPFKYAMAQNVFWVFSHGIRGTGSDFYTLQNGLGVYNSGSISYSYDWANQTLVNQAIDLAGDINTVPNLSTSKVILVGQSQGGLRVRQYLQQTGTSSTYSAARNRVRSLAVIGAPNYGAPIANNGPGLVSQALSAVSGIFTYGLWLPGAYGALQPTIYGASQKIIDNYVGAGINEMRPGSDFVNRLNNAPYQTCSWQSYSHTHYFLWFSWSETHWYKVCPETNYPGFNPIPSNVATMNIIGQNSNLDNWLRAGFSPAADRQMWAIAATAVAALAWGLAFWTFGLTAPAAIAFTNIAIFLWALPAMWARALGSDRNDILITRIRRI